MSDKSRARRRAAVYATREQAERWMFNYLEEWQCTRFRIQDRKWNSLFWGENSAK